MKSFTCKRYLRINWFNSMMKYLWFWILLNIRLNSAALPQHELKLFLRQVHSTHLLGADDLGLQGTLVVDKDGGEVLVWIVGNAGGGDGSEELGAGELGGQSVHVLVDQSTERDALLVEVEHHEHAVTGLVHLLDIVHGRDLSHGAETKIKKFLSVSPAMSIAALTWI